MLWVMRLCLEFGKDIFCSLGFSFLFLLLYIALVTMEKKCKYNCWIDESDHLSFCAHSIQEYQSTLQRLMNKLSVFPQPDNYFPSASVMY